MLELALVALLGGALWKGFLDRRMYRTLLYDSERTAGELQDRVEQLEGEVRYLEARLTVPPPKAQPKSRQVSKKSTGPVTIQSTERMKELTDKFRKMGYSMSEATEKMIEALAPIIEAENELRQQGITMVIQEEPEL